MISEFNSEIEGSLAFCALMLFLCSILCLMCSGRSLHVECILTFGMLCLSAWRMMFVKMVFAGHQHGDVIQADIPPICYCKDTREGDSSLHHT